MSNLPQLQAKIILKIRCMISCASHLLKKNLNADVSARRATLQCSMLSGFVSADADTSHLLFASSERLDHQENEADGSCSDVLKGRTHLQWEVFPSLKLNGDCLCLHLADVGTDGVHFGVPGACAGQG